LFEATVSLTLLTHPIRLKDIYNFDETKLKLGLGKAQNVAAEVGGKQRVDLRSMLMCALL
jgi:hypothetical protein